MTTTIFSYFDWGTISHMQLIIFMGIQASGKSSYYLLNLVHSHLRINLDMLKTRHREKIIFEAGLASKTKMVIDNTNPTLADRARYIASAQAAGFEIVGYSLRLSLKVYLNATTHAKVKPAFQKSGSEPPLKNLNHHTMLKALMHCINFVFSGKVNFQFHPYRFEALMKKH